MIYFVSVRRRAEGRRHILAAIDSVSPRCGDCAHDPLMIPSLTMLKRPSPALQRRGKKLLVLDPKISAYLGFLTEITLLREHGVERRAVIASSASC